MLSIEGVLVNPRLGKEPMDQRKPFQIPKTIVWDAYKRVKQNKGACGVDEVSIQDFERDLEDNLYKLWNRMSSGSYLPPAVRRVEIPKKDGSMRPLGIPTVQDRIAQMVVKMILEPKVEPHFHPDSYGYRPKKSAIEALGVARKRCWRYDWVLDVDIQGFFDNLDHTLLMNAIKKHTDSKWVCLYIERWLKAPGQDEEGILHPKDKGTPQGGVISPLLANLFLHYAFDKWMWERFPAIPFERYADDIVIHCKQKEAAEILKVAITNRLADYKLALNPQKTKLVYCKDSNRAESFPNESFDFLGYTFRPRRVKSHDGTFFVGFTPAVSNESATQMRRTMRKWQLHLRSGSSLERLAKEVNPILRGWIGYYGQYQKSQLNPVFYRLNLRLVKWAMRKYKRLRGHQRRAAHWLGRIARQNPNLFAHWQLSRPSAGRTTGAV